jgi:PAS domain S-box-containing protein
MTPADVRELLGVITAASAVVVSGWKGVQFTRTKLAKRRETEASKVATLNALHSTVTHMLPIIEDVQKELKANGGGSLRDAINEIRNEQALERAARRVMTNIASFEVRIDNEEARVLHVSPAYVHLTGLTREDVEDDGWLRAVVPEDRDRVGASGSRAYAENKVFVTTYTVQHVHTHERTAVEHTGTPVFNAAGLCVGWVGVLRPQTGPRTMRDILIQEA